MADLSITEAQHCVNNCCGNPPTIINNGIICPDCKTTIIRSEQQPLWDLVCKWNMLHPHKPNWHYMAYNFMNGWQ